MSTEKKRKEGTGHGVDLQDRQKVEPPKKYKVVYNEPTVYQERNQHNLIKDFKDEYIGYVNSLNLVESLYKNSESIHNFLPKLSSLAFNEWRRLIK